MQIYAEPACRPIQNTRAWSSETRRGGELELGFTTTDYRTDLAAISSPSPFLWPSCRRRFVLGLN